MQCESLATLSPFHVIILLMDQSFGGSFKGFIDEFHRRYHGQGSALDLVKMVIDTFPSFRDQVWYQGRTGENHVTAPPFDALHTRFFISLFLEKGPNPRSGALGCFLSRIFFDTPSVISGPFRTSYTRTNYVCRLSRTPDSTPPPNPTLPVFFDAFASIRR